MQDTTEGKQLTNCTYLLATIRDEGHVQVKWLMNQLLTELVSVLLAKTGRVHAVSFDRIGHATPGGIRSATKPLQHCVYGVVRGINRA